MNKRSRAGATPAVFADEASVPLRSRHFEFWILLFCTLILFFQPIFLNQTFYFRDLHLHFFPQKLRFVEFLRAGELPLWDSYLHGGQPYLADLNNMALYPTNFLYAISPVFALNFDIILHIFLCAAGAYLLARSLGLSPLASTIAGGVYAFCGYTLSLANLLNRLAAMPYLPFLLWTFERFFVSGKTRWFVFAALIGALQILAGAPEMTVLTWCTLFVWMIARNEPRSFLSFVVLIALIIGVAAVQILPAIEMVRQSSRAAGADYATFSAWSLNPRRLPEIILPGFLGSASAITKQGYWGWRLESMGFPFILSIYFGVVTILCAFFGIARARWSKLFAALIAISLLLSLGSYLPLFHGIYANLHFLAGARYPIKIFAIALLPVSLLVAAGFDEICSLNFAGKRKVSIILWTLSFFLLICYGLVASSTTITTKILEFFFYSASETARQGLRHSILHATLITVLASLFYHLWLQQRAQWLQRCFAGVILVDLLWAGFSVNSYAPKDFFNAEPPLAKSISNHLQGGRLYRGLNTPGLKLKLPGDNKLYLYRWNLETLQGYSGSMYSIPVIYHEDYDDLAKQEINRISDWMLRASWEKRIPLLKAGGVTIIISPDPIQSSGIQQLSRVTNSSSMTLNVYRIADSEGLAFVPQQIESTENAFGKMTENDFNPYRTSYVTGDDIHAQGCTNKIEDFDRRSNHWKLKIHSECNTYLVFAQPFYKGWATKIDGVEVSSLEANYAFTASPIMKGDHVVERIYNPASFRYGWMISIVSIASLIVIARVVRTPRPR